LLCEIISGCGDRQRRIQREKEIEARKESSRGISAATEKRESEQWGRREVEKEEEKEGEKTPILSSLGSVGREIRRQTTRSRG
jgi:hypothetical protein